MSPERAKPFYYIRCRSDWWAAYRTQVTDPDRTVVFFVRADEPAEGIPTAQSDRLVGVAQQLARKDDGGWARDEHAYSYK